MRSLFLRIFLWFWLATGIAVAVLVVSSPLFTRSRTRLGEWQRRAESGLQERSADIAARFDTEGFEALAERPGRRHRRGPFHTFLFDLDGTEVEGREPPREVRAAAERAAASRAVEVERSGSMHLLARPVRAPDGAEYVLVMTLRRPPRPIDLLEPRVLAPRLAILILVAGVLCFWLARHLASPIVALRHATQQLKAGDLSARVGGSVGSRRDEIGDLAREFDSMAERIESLVASHRRLLRDVSHELRSPLARLAVALELARQRAGEGADSALDRIERESERLNALIGQLLILTRVETGDDDGASAEVNLEHLLREVVNDAEFEAGARDVSVRLNSKPGSSVTGWHLLLRSAFDNVIRNAVRYSAEGSEVEVTVHHSEAPPEILVTVRDHGPGVPDDNLESLFEPFFRVADARDRKSGGTGLGLAITARAMRLHGGTATARNAEGGGLIVEMRLPGERSTLLAPFRRGDSPR